MKRNFVRNMIVATLLATLGGSLASCTLESSDNGKLDGMWHMVAVDTLSTGGVSDLSEETMFWAVQHNLLTMRDYKSKSFIMRFTQTADSLLIYDPYYNDRAQADPPVTDAAVLAIFGIDGLEDGFQIETLNGSSMLLRSRRFRIHFVRF